MSKNKLIKKINDIEKYFDLKINSLSMLASEKYPILVSQYYLNLVDKSDPLNDPIFKQFIPSNLELSDSEYSEDPQDEHKYEIVPKLIHRYPDRALIITTNKCSTFCRFCFRKRYWKSGNDQKELSEKELSEIVTYIQNHPEIKEILLSGGDFLMLNYKKIESILTAISEIKTVEVIRIASRVPVTMPGIINKKLVNMISTFEKVWIITHFNHPKEITEGSMSICKEFIKKGTPVFNQTVLLKGINDNKEALKQLFQLLVSNKIKPLYLFHIDPVKGVTHFATGIEKGLELLRDLRGEISSLATPTFSIDLPEGGGKVALQPSYSEDGIHFELDNKRIKYI